MILGRLKEPLGSADLQQQIGGHQVMKNGVFHHLVTARFHHLETPGALGTKGRPETSRGLSRIGFNKYCPGL